jgi:hypothetical protein
VSLSSEGWYRLKGNGNTVEPLALPIPDAQRVSGLSRSEIYRRLAAGDIRAIKSGSRTLILMDSLRAHLAALPAATFRAPKATAPGRPTMGDADPHRKVPRELGQ